MPDAPHRDATTSQEPPARLSRRDTWRLVFATYRATFPYLVATVLGLVLATWIVTTLFAAGSAP